MKHIAFARYNIEIMATGMIPTNNNRLTEAQLQSDFGADLRLI